MSNPGNKNTPPATDEAMVRSRFLAGRATAASGIDPEVLALAEGGGGTQTATPGKPSPAATPPSAGLPIGLRVQQWLSGHAQADRAAQAAQVADAAKGGMADAFTGAIAGAWDKLKQDFAASHALVSSPEASAAFQKAGFWDQAKAVFQENMAAGRLPVDAFNVAVSPLSGAASAATKGLDEGVHKILPFVPSGTVKAAIDQSLIGLGPKGGPLSDAGAAEGAGAASRAVPAGEGPKGGAAAPAVETGASGPPKAGWPEGKPAVADEDGLPPQGWDNSLDPTTGKKWDPNMPFSARFARTLRAFPGFRQVPFEAEEPAKAPRAFDIAGEEPGSTIKVTPALRTKAVNYINGGGAQNPIEVHLDALADDATRNEAVNQIAKIIPKDKVKPVDVTQMNAYSLNLTPDEVMATVRPQFPSDETMYAAHMVLNSAAEQFWKAARVAQETGAPEDMEKATRAYALFNKYAGDLRDAKTDWGRAGRIQQEASQAHAGFAGQISDMIQQVGPDNVDEMIRKTAQLDDPRQVAPFVSSTRTMGGRDSLLYGWYNWLLSNPATVVKKMTSDAAVATWNTAVRYAAEKFGSGDVRPGEAAALFTGYVGSMRDGLTAAAKALYHGESQFYGDYRTMDGRVVTRTDNHPPEPIEDEAPTRGAIEWLRSALPTSWIGAADDFAKVINYRAEARALAYRDGMIKGLSGADLSDHVTQTMTNVPQHIHDQAVSAALRNTFQEPLTGIAENVQDIADGLNIPIPGTNWHLPFGRVIMPFVKVPANIAKFAYRNSALAMAFPSSALKAELAAGGATADLARARIGLGTAASMIVLPFMLQGKITGRGPADPQINAAWQRDGNKPYSVRVGDHWYNYNKVEPIGMHMAMLADTIDTLRYAHDEDAASLAWSASFGIGDAMLSKTYLQGLSDFINALHDPDERAYAGNKLVATMAVPQGAAALAQSFDAQLRAHYAMLDGIAARTPGLSTSLPPVRDQWGQPVSKDAGYVPIPFATGTAAANMLSPIDMAQAGDAQPIDKWIWDNREAFPNDGQGRLGLTRPGQVQSFEAPGGRVSAQLQLTPKQLDRLREQAGNGLKDPRTGLGARDALNALVAGNSPDGNAQRQWDQASPAARATMVLRVWNQYRDAAKKQVLAENPDMQAALAEKFNTRVQALKAPTIGGSP